MQPPQNQARCGSCGAPDDGELVYCRFCKNAISAQLLESAIPCPQCRTACRWGKQKCVQCSAWLVVACVFCGAISPHNQPGCMACREPFAGAMQRKQAQMQAAQQQQRMQAVNTYGNVAASFLGAAVGGAAAHSWFSPGIPHHHHSWGSSDGSSWDNSSSFDNSGSYDNSSSYDNSGGGATGAAARVSPARRTRATQAEASTRAAAAATGAGAEMGRSASVAIAIAVCALAACGAFVGTDSSGANGGGSGNGDAASAADGTASAQGDGAVPMPDGAAPSDSGISSEAGLIGDAATKDAGVVCAEKNGLPTSYCPSDGQCYPSCTGCANNNIDCFDCRKGTPSQGTCVAAVSSVTCPGHDSCTCTTSETQCPGGDQVCPAFGALPVSCLSCGELATNGLECKDGLTCNAGEKKCK